MRTDKERLSDILESIRKIEQYVSRGEEAFRSDEMLQVWFIHHIQIIGEASANISGEFKSTFSSIPWQDIIDMRQVLVHRYFGVSLNEIWDTINIDIPEIKMKIEDILNQLNNQV